MYKKILNHFNKNKFLWGYFTGVAVANIIRVIQELT